MPTEPRAAADFVNVDPDVYTDASGRRWMLGLDESTSPPTAVFVAVMTWERFKSLWATWDAVESGRTWGIVKGT